MPTACARMPALAQFGRHRLHPERHIDSAAALLTLTDHPGLDLVVVFIRVIARGGASGLPSERETAHVWSVRDGRLAAIRIFRDRADALEALAL